MEVDYSKTIYEQKTYVGGGDRQVIERAVVHGELPPGLARFRARIGITFRDSPTGSEQRTLVEVDIPKATNIQEAFEQFESSCQSEAAKAQIDKQLQRMFARTARHAGPQILDATGRAL